MVSRDAIRQIQTPIYLMKTPLLKTLLTADLLWADPSREDPPFGLSDKF